MAGWIARYKLRIDMEKSSLQVVLQRCSRYERTAIAEQIALAMDYLPGFDALHGKTVLLKPNLISSQGPRLACSHGDFVAGAALWFLGHGARVLVGDSPAFGSAVKVCEKQGVAEALKGLDLRLVDFVSPVRTRLACGVTVSIAEEALSCDYFVGLPKVKAHKQMYMTMAVKNIFGIVKGTNKALLHMKHGKEHDQFAEIIIDLLQILPPQLHIADGLEVMHNSGPLDGSPLWLNCLAVSACPVALDSAMFDLLQLEKGKSPLWRVAAKRGLPGSDSSRVDYPLLAPGDFYGSGFVAPDVLNGIRFTPWNFLRGLGRRLLLKLSG